MIYFVVLRNRYAIAHYSLNSMLVFVINGIEHRNCNELLRNNRTGVEAKRDVEFRHSLALPLEFGKR